MLVYLSLKIMNKNKMKKMQEHVDFSSSLLLSLVASITSCRTGWFCCFHGYRLKLLSRRRWRSDAVILHLDISIVICDSSLDCLRIDLLRFLLSVFLVFCPTGESTIPPPLRQHQEHCRESVLPVVKTIRDYIPPYFAQMNVVQQVQDRRKPYPAT